MQYFKNYAAFLCHAILHFLYMTGDLRSLARGFFNLKNLPRRVT